MHEGEVHMYSLSKVMQAIQEIASTVKTATRDIEVLQRLSWITYYVGTQDM